MFVVELSVGFGSFTITVVPSGPFTKISMCPPFALCTLTPRVTLVIDALSGTLIGNDAPVVLPAGTSIPGSAPATYGEVAVALAATLTPEGEGPVIVPEIV